MSNELVKLYSLSELKERLNRNPYAIILGDDDQHHHEYYIAMIGTCQIGICSQGHGLVPSIRASNINNTVWVGYNSKVAYIDVVSCKILSLIELESLFYETLCEMADGSIIFIHELGVKRVSGSGVVIWTVDADDIEFAIVNEPNIIRIRENDGKEKIIDKYTGNTI